VIAMKGRIQSLARDVNAHLSERIAEAGDERLTAYRIESDAVEILQRLYYFAKRIAKAVVDASWAEDGQETEAAAIGAP
jgi:phosphate:Na+ symporter